MIFLGKKTTISDFQDLQKYAHSLSFATTHSKISRFHPSIQLIRPIQIQNAILVFMPNSQEKKLAERFSIPYYKQRSLWKILGRTIYDLKKQVFFAILKLFAQTKTPPINQNNVVVLKIDAIGDYLLFRNFLDPIYKKYGKITLIANESCRDVIDQFDSAFLSKVIFVNRTKLIKNISYAIRFFRTIQKYKYPLLIHPTYSRDILAEEIAKNIFAKEKIAPYGDYSNLTPKEKKHYDKTYTCLTSSSSKIMFEFFRNLEFFKQLIGDEIHVDYTLELQETDHVLEKFNLQKPYSVLFIGASAPFRKWGSQHFATVGQFLLSHKINLIICGGKEDFQKGEEIREELKAHQNNITNLCGQTTLSELAGIVYNGNHLVSNETSCVHIAHAIRHDKIFVVSNGNHLYRFTPYPKGIGGKSIEIFHPTIQKNLDAYGTISNFIQERSRLDINDIQAHQVISAIKTLK